MGTVWYNQCVSTRWNQTIRLCPLPMCTKTLSDTILFRDPIWNFFHAKYFRQVALGGHCPSLASSHHCIFASSWHCIGRYCGGFRSITSSHLRNLGSPEFLIPSPQLRIFAASQLRLSRFSETLFASSHLRLSRFSETLSAASHLRIFGSPQSLPPPPLLL